MIAQYQAQDKEKELSSARLYALSQSHKHLKEMKAISGLERTPLFSPYGNRLLQWYDSKLDFLC